MQSYVNKLLRGRALLLIDAANKIITDYQARGFQLTLRQLYYQFVAHDLFPDDLKWKQVGNNKWVRDANGTKNAPPNYKLLGDVINDGRLCGLVDWSAIVDRTRELRGLQHWEGPHEILRAVVNSYHVDHWEGQVTVPEVWIEKDALIGVFEKVCRSLDVSYFACRGYTSQSEMWEAGQRFLRRYDETGRTTTILHFGDHDPSGVDMTRDIEDRLRMFTGVNGDDIFTLNRLALTIEQIRKFNPPPNPAKITDSRANEYIRKYGDESWELDALDPTVIDKLVRDNVEDLVAYPDAWEKAHAKQKKGRSMIEKAAKTMEKP